MEIKQAHTENDKRTEIKLMLSRGKGITLATLMRLYLADSAIIKGGKYDKEEEAKTHNILGGFDHWMTAKREITAAFHALEIIVPAHDSRGKSDVDPFSPEWLADVVAIAARGGNDTAVNILHSYPLALVLHLVAEEHRHNGATTRRPLDKKSVLAALEDLHGGQRN